MPPRPKTVVLVAMLLLAHAARAEPLGCGPAAISAERDSGVPTGLLGAIGSVETGRLDQATGRADAWPWSTNLAGVGHYFSSKAEAIAWTAGQIASGQVSIDVGCFQINLKYHPAAFANLDDAFDPLSNARYAAVFLTGLYRRLGQWTTAVEYYHSADPALGQPYGQRVMALLGGGEMRPPSALPPDLQSRPVAARLFRFAMQVIIPQWAQLSGNALAISVRHAAYKPNAGARGWRRSVSRLPVVFRPLAG